MSNKYFFNNWPVYFKDRLIVSNLKSSVAIATLWTPKELVQKLVPADSFSIIGQLYTKKGINYIVRNILARPLINKIYIVGSDLMGSGEAFLRLMKNGLDDKYGIVGDNVGKIESEISLGAIEDFRKNVELVDLSGIENLKKIKEELKKSSSKCLKRAAGWRKPEIFPDPPKVETSRCPSEVGLIKIRRPTIAEAYLSALKHISMFGMESEAMIGYVSYTSKMMKEITNLAIVVTEEEPGKWHLPDYMPFTKEDIWKYFDGFFRYDKGTEDYTYGERLYNFSAEEIDKLKQIYPWMKIDRFQKYFTHGGFDQIAISIVRKLKNFKYDKGAIALLANPFRDVFPQRPPKKTPCLFLIQCQIYQGEVNLTAYFRSNDIYNAWPLNAFALRKLQSEIAQKLEVKLGPLITISNMAHIYEHNWRDAEELVKRHYKGNCEWDPRGNFHVATDGNDIVVKLVTPRGNEQIKEWRMNGKGYKVAAKLAFKIIEEDLAVSVLGNAADLALQVERAETAIKLGLHFDQDNPLDFSKLKK